jgi:hypothetical protein
MYRNILEGGGDTQSNKRFEQYEVENLVISPASNVSRNLPTAAAGPAGTSFLKKDIKKTKHQQQILRDDDDDNDNDRDDDRNEGDTPRTSSSTDDVRMKELSSVIHKNDNSQDVKNIDDVFIRITDIYTQEMYNIMYNTLILIQNNDQMYNSYMDGLNRMLEPTNNKIKKWIDEHIVF